jgi:hypothetical protein
MQYIIGFPYPVQSEHETQQALQVSFHGPGFRRIAMMKNMEIHPGIGLPQRFGHLDDTTVHPW